MELHQLNQGSPEWHAHRLTHFNASDAPAMMGCSPYKTRSQLLHEMHTGMAPEVDAATQRRFDEGHRFEALARPLAEEIIGDDLYPVVGSLIVSGLNRKLGASFDGLTMGRRINSEHKRLNAKLRTALTTGQQLSLNYRVQMEQQMLVAGVCEKTLFMASDWDIDDTLIEEHHVWYSPDLELRQQIIDGWIQFEKDLVAYVPPVAEVKTVAAPQFGLPAVSIQVNGSIALIDNLQVFGAALTAYIERINKSPETDQDFADLEATVKTLKNAEDALDAAESGALAQTESIDVMRRTVAMYRDTARTNRLLIDKLVKSEKEARKLAIVSEAAAELVTHIKALNQRLGAAIMPTIASDFPGAVKGLKSIDSMRDKVAVELARCKIEANATADRIGVNLKAIDQAEFQFLFADRNALALKDSEFVAMAIKNRVDAHKTAEAARLEAERARIAEEERVKAEAAAKVRADAEIAAAAEAQAEANRQAEASRQAEAAAAAAIESAKKPESAVAHVPFEAVVALMPETVREAMRPDAREPGYVPHYATPPALKLGVICTRLGFQVSADFLRTLGFEPAGRERAAVLYHEADFPRICTALIRHVTEVQQGVPA